MPADSTILKYVTVQRHPPGWRFSLQIVTLIAITSIKLVTHPCLKV